MTALKTVPLVQSHRILIVDDDELTMHALEKIMHQHGFTEVRSTTDPRRCLPLFRELEPDIVLLDLHMPGLDGFAVLNQIQTRVADGHFLPVIVLSDDLTTDVKQKALAAGAADFMAKPFEPSEISLRVRNLLRLRELTGRLEERVAERTRELKAAEIDVANRMALVAEYRDYPDGAHVQRVGRVSAIIARTLGRSEQEVALIRYAAPLHDIGKVAIPDSILLKPAPLTLEELDVMKAHTTIGARMLSGSSSPILQMAEEIALYHHENWDGTGYTPGLKSEQIPLPGRIVAVADVFDALTHARPYKRPWTIEQAMDWMESMRARKFDPAVLDALFSAIDSVERAADEPEPASEQTKVAELPLITPAEEHREREDPDVHIAASA